MNGLGVFHGETCFLWWVARRFEASVAKYLKAIMNFTFITELIFTVPFHFISLVCNNLLSLIYARFFYGTFSRGGKQDILNNSVYF